MTVRVTQTAEETEQAGRDFAARLKPGDIVALVGPLGSGKTRFVAGICAALGAGGHFGSPTFTLINEYPAGPRTIVHADMYRITSRAEVLETGLSEYFTATCICLIEWADHVLDLLPEGHYLITFEHCADHAQRLITISIPGEAAA